MTDNIILVGFMGAGKSSVGRILARRLQRCLVETDDMIVAREGRSIPEIFASKGEAYFRAAEEEALALLALKRGEVIATGGGLPCREGRPQALQALGHVIWLSADFDTLLDRALRGGDRPMLAGRSRADVLALYHAREPFYRQSTLTVDGGAGPVEAVAARIISALRSRDAVSAGPSGQSGMKGR